MSSWCTQGHLYLCPLFSRNDSNIYLDIILSHRTWGRCGVMEHCVILQYCVVLKQRMLLYGDQNWAWNLWNLCACWCSFCVMLIYCLCVWLLVCSSALTTVVWTRCGNFLTVFPKVPRIWHALTHTGLDKWRILNGCMFVLCAVHSSPLHCRPFSVYR